MDSSRRTCEVHTKLPFGKSGGGNGKIDACSIGRNRAKARMFMPSDINLFPHRAQTFGCFSLVPAPPAGDRTARSSLAASPPRSPQHSSPLLLTRRWYLPVGEWTPRALRPRFMKVRGDSLLCPTSPPPIKRGAHVCGIRRPRLKNLECGDLYYRIRWPNAINQSGVRTIRVFEKKESARKENQESVNLPRAGEVLSPF